MYPVGFFSVLMLPEWDRIGSSGGDSGTIGGVSLTGGDAAMGCELPFFFLVVFVFFPSAAAATSTARAGAGATC